MRVALPPPDSFAQYQERKLCLCALHSCSTTSGVRTWKRYSGLTYNPSRNSKHLIDMGGWSDDLVADDMSTTHRAQIVADARVLGLIPDDEGDHIHIQGKKAGPL